MNILADENIPLIDDFFSQMGTVRQLPGRNLTTADIDNADVLLVRSVTQVGKELLAGTHVKFVGTATSGVDHIDQRWLHQQGIGFASAAGCNAESVVDYVFSALNVLAEQHDFSWEDRVFGIVGYGHVGSRLQQRLTALGLTCLICDPFVDVAENQRSSVKQVSLEELLAKSDVISLHTPITCDGLHPTFHLLNDQHIRSLKKGTVLINAARGGVIDDAALKRRLQQDNDLHVVLDVWEGEPKVDSQLLALIDIGTPHIAGYSLDGKVRGTAMVYKATCQHFGLPARVREGNVLPIPALRSMTFTDDACLWDATTTAVRAVYDLRRDDMRMRKTFLARESATDNTISGAFDALRKNYPERREFSSLKIRLRSDAVPLHRNFEALGFRIEVIG